MGGHTDVPPDPSHLRGDGTTSLAAWTPQNLPQAPLGTSSQAEPISSRGLGQSCPHPVVPECHLSRWYLRAISGFTFVKYLYIEVSDRHLAQLNLQAFHCAIQNIPPFFWTYFPLGLENWHTGQKNTALPCFSSKPSRWYWIRSKRYLRSINDSIFPLFNESNHKICSTFCQLDTQHLSL